MGGFIRRSASCTGKDEGLVGGMGRLRGLGRLGQVRRVGQVRQVRRVGQVRQVEGMRRL